MSSVAQHYASHLAPIYVWMAGGLEPAFAQGASEVADFLGSARSVVDLGAGFGMHAVPLARAGARVLAIDTSAQLLDELARCSAGLAVRTVQAELLEFPAHLPEHPDLILCMGDTLTHLAGPGQVEQLLRAVAAALRPGGSFLATFRDYRTLPSGEGRFIPVRGDEQRILTCFLEDQGEHVRVHDVLHERVAGAWQLRVSSYLKCRLDPEAVVAVATSMGLRCTLQTSARGMLRLRADA